MADDWNKIEEIIARSVRHFAAVRSISTPDSYTTEMALRHAIQCGAREFVDALEVLQRVYPKGFGFSLLSEDARKAYLVIRGLEYEELATPSVIEPETLVDAIAAAKVMAEFLPADRERINKEIGGV